MTSSPAVPRILEILAEGEGSVIGGALPPDALEDLARHASIKEYASNSVIFHEGDSPEMFCLLLSGEAKICKLRSQGRECVLCIITPGRILDPAVLYYRGGLPASAVALGACRILRIPCADMLELAERHSSLALTLVRALSFRQRLFINRAAEQQGSISVPRRVASWLLHRRRMEKSDTVGILRTRELLAQVLGVSRESLSRELNALARAGIIRLERRRVTILDEGALRRAMEK